MDMYNELPTNLFKVRVPILATYDDEEKELFGIPITYTDGVKANKSRIESDTLQMTTIMLNLDKIINVYMDGNPITLCNDDDIYTIYNILEKYIRNVDDSASYSPNRRLLKETRVEEIDKLLSDMFTNNKKVIVKQVVGNDSGYNLGVNLFRPTVPEYEQQENSEVGVLSGYNNGYSATYGNDNLPDVKIEKVTRLSYRSQFN